MRLQGWKPIQLSMAVRGMKRDREERVPEQDEIDDHEDADGDGGAEHLERQMFPQTARRLPCPIRASVEFSHGEASP